MNVELLMNDVIRADRRGEDLAEVMVAALGAVDPGVAVRRALRDDDDTKSVIGRKIEEGSDGRVIWWAQVRPGR